jgi:isopenicillin N synthase-like dioxygenase
MADFQEVPILDWSLSDGETRSQFLIRLRHAIINVGFLYLRNHPVPKEVVQEVKSYIPKLFAIPQAEKDAIRMANSPHFLGYSRLGAELTRGATDQREQFDFATNYDCPYKDGDPEFVKLWGQPQVREFFT